MPPSKVSKPRPLLIVSLPPVVAIQSFPMGVKEMVSSPLPVRRLVKASMLFKVMVPVGRTIELIRLVIVNAVVTALKSALLRVSLPAPPLIVSLPPPASMVSFPSPPLIVSLSPPVTMESSLLVPVIRKASILLNVAWFTGIEYSLPSSQPM